MFKQTFTLSTGSKKLIAVMSVVTVVAVMIAYNYYGHVNDVEDPRILIIKRMHLRYNQAVIENDKDLAMSLLDTMDMEFAKIDHYKRSFERGVISTDKAAIYINSALYGTSNEDEKIKLLDLAEKTLNKSLEFYGKWQDQYSKYSDHDMIEKVSADFADIDSEYKQEIIERRASNLIVALKEIDRRFSVTYTNLGIVMRHKFKQDSAIAFYKMALDLWDENHIARSNLNVLMGKEPIKRGVVDKLFPPERE